MITLKKVQQIILIDVIKFFHNILAKDIIIDTINYLRNNKNMLQIKERKKFKFKSAPLSKRAEKYK